MEDTSLSSPPCPVRVGLWFPLVVRVDDCSVLQRNIPWCCVILVHFHLSTELRGTRHLRAFGSEGSSEALISISMPIRIYVVLACALHH